MYMIKVSVYIDCTNGEMVDTRSTVVDSDGVMEEWKEEPETRDPRMNLSFCVLPVIIIVRTLTVYHLEARSL